MRNKKTAPAFKAETVLWVAGFEEPIQCHVDKVVIVEEENGDRAYVEVDIWGHKYTYPLSDIIDVNENNLPQAA